MPLYLLPFLLALFFTIGTDGSAWPPVQDANPGIRTVEGSASNTVVPHVVAKIELEDIAMYARGGSDADTFVRFSPDSRLLAIGTYLGRILMVDAYTGESLWDTRVAEGMVKQIDFSPDGRTVYFGEQSPDGFVYAADTRTGDIRWKFRLADDLETSAPPEKGDIWGVYTLPGCFSLKALANGDVMVLGLHSWGDWRKPETRRRLARLYRISREGKVLWAFPEGGPAPMTIIYADTDPNGRRVVFLTTEMAPNAPEDYALAPGAMVCLDGTTGKMVGAHVFEPLDPYFEKVLFWQSVSVGPEGKRAAIGLHDGRSYLFDLDTVEPIHAFDFGKPILISGVPVAARSTYTTIAPDGTTYFQTASSSVPSGAGSGQMTEPPGPHPNANTINAVGPDGKVLWRYRGHYYQNFWSSDDGRWVLTSAQRDDKRSGRSAGAILFDAVRPGGGSAKFVYYYQFKGKSHFQADISPDGALIAVVESPYQNRETKMLEGAYQVHIVR